MGALAEQKAAVRTAEEVALKEHPIAVAVVLAEENLGDLEVVLEVLPSLEVLDLVEIGAEEILEGGRNPVAGGGAP